MGIYESLGVRPFINVSTAAATRWGGVLMKQETLDAMTEAAKNQCVSTSFKPLPARLSPRKLMPKPASLPAEQPQFLPWVQQPA
jgi:hypothetical protein